MVEGDECVLDSSLRLIRGDAAGLSERWRHGVAIAFPGRLQFRARLAGPLAVFKRTPIELVIQSATMQTPPITGRRDAWSIRPGLSLIELTTPTAVLSWAVPPKKVDRALNALRQ